MLFDYFYTCQFIGGGLFNKVLLVSLLSFISMFLVLLLTFLKFVIRDYSLGVYSREEVRSYECGFEQYSLSRIPISIRYFLLTLVFLIFDLEVILLMFTPSDLFLGVSSSFVIVYSILFLLILFLGLLFE